MPDAPQLGTRKLPLLTIVALALVGLSGVVASGCRPSADTVLEATAFDLDGDAAIYAGRTFRLVVSDDDEQVEGALRGIVRVHERSFPILTHDAVIVDGDFADSARVHVSPIRRHNAKWRAKFKPRGQFLVARLIPRTLEVARALEALSGSEHVRLTTRRVKGEVREGDDVVWSLCSTFVVSEIDVVQSESAP